MKDFLNQNKIFIEVVLGTLVLLFGGVFLFSRGGSANTSGGQVNSALLEPAGGQTTGGIVDGNYIQASASAKVNLVEFGDYECPACGSYNALVKQVLTEFAGKITFAFKNFPLSQHTNANISSYAAEAAGLQGKFWQMHDKLYETQSVWTNSTDAGTIFKVYANDLGLDHARFESDIDSQKVKDIVEKDLGDGNAIGINSTPTFYLNGIKMDNPQNINDFTKIIQEALNK
jgi:protein-disulfide isomerase